MSAQVPEHRTISRRSLSKKKSAVVQSLEARTIEIRMKIASAVVEDTKFRFPGVTEGLYTLDALTPFSRVEPFVVPSLINSTDDVGITVAPGDAHFKDRLLKRLPAFAGFDFLKHGLCIAGGSVSALVMSPDGASLKDKEIGALKDFDMFLVGHKTDGEVLDAIRALASHLANAWTKTGPMFVYRTKNCVSFYCEEGGRADGPYFARDGLVQVVLRRYSTTAEVLHSFDLGSSAFLWDGQRVYMTALGKLAAEHGINVLNLKARRSSYERRLARYFERGYSIVLSQLDAGAVLAAYGRMPYLRAKGSVNIVNGSIMARHLVASRPSDDEDMEGEVEGIPCSDYEVSNVPYESPRRIGRNNMFAMLKPVVNVNGLVAMAVWRQDLDIFSIQPEMEEDGLYARVKAMIGSGQIDPVSFKNLLGSENAIRVMMVLLSEKVEDCGWKTMVRELCDARRLEIEARCHIPFVIMGVEDNTSLVGPYNRLVVDEAAWYGDCAAGAYIRRLVNEKLQSADAKPVAC